MWWMFEKISDTGSIVLYAYSRENRNLDGRISINRDTHEIIMIQPSAEDSGIKFAEDKAIEKAWRIIALGYPDHRQIACG